MAYEAVNQTPEILELLTANHIKLQLSAPFAHWWQNGQIERDVQAVMDIARTLMSSFPNVPLSMWAWAVYYAAYVINRTPMTYSHLTPFEMVTGIKPNHLSKAIPFCFALEYFI